MLVTCLSFVPLLVFNCAIKWTSNSFPTWTRLTFPLKMVFVSFLKLSLLEAGIPRLELNKNWEEISLVCKFYFPNTDARGILSFSLLTCALLVCTFVVFSPIGLMHADVRIQHFTIKPRFCKIVLQRKNFHISQVGIFLIHTALGIHWCNSGGLVVRQENLT